MSMTTCKTLETLAINKEFIHPKEFIPPLMNLQHCPALPSRSLMGRPIIRFFQAAATALSAGYVNSFSYPAIFWYN